MNSNIHQIEVNTREDFAKFLEFIKNGYIFKVSLRPWRRSVKKINKWNVENLYCLSVASLEIFSEMN
ncbi:hypothetical protein CAPN006_06740 [Capnocytophaga canimorsus]|uniref:hypothetical protein n=1 Tax=Capnocytophaga canimorsus TaxID=28188 RepID=UPI001AC01FD9|nr:hypothetical protein [Capnocytophaga canimorsus]GIM56280.1 hypothetical protein CAPN006_06740 [Capnocytophaga canimorsus]